VSVLLFDNSACSPGPTYTPLHLAITRISLHALSYRKLSTPWLSKLLLLNSDERCYVVQIVKGSVRLRLAHQLMSAALILVIHFPVLQTRSADTFVTKRQAMPFICLAYNLSRHRTPPLRHHPEHNHVRLHQLQGRHQGHP